MVELDENKMWYTSKVVWLNFILTLIGALTLVSDYMSSNTTLTAPGVIMIVIGILGVVLRVWFTDTPVAKSLTKR